jgi:hypothetical protein
MLGEKIHHFVEGLLISAILGNEQEVVKHPLSHLGLARWRKSADQLGWIGQPLGWRNKTFERAAEKIKE